MKRIALIFSLFLLAQCGPVPAPPVPVPPPVVTESRTEAVHLGVPGCAVTLEQNSQVIGTVTTDAGGGALFVVTMAYLGGAPAPGTLNLAAAASCEGYDPWRVSWVAAAHGNQDVCAGGSSCGPNQGIVLAPLVADIVPLPALHTSREFFATPAGPFSVVEETDFNLLAVFIADPAAADRVLTQRAAIGFNVARVFTAYNVAGIGRLIPREHPDLYSTQIPGLLTLADRHRVYLELVAFTGPYQAVFATDDEKVAHWTALNGVLAGRPKGSVLLEEVNEYNNAPNADIPIARLLRDPRVMTSHGSGILDTLPLLPIWDYATVHWTEPRKVAHNGMEDVADVYHVPVVVNETVRVPDNDQSPAHAFDAAAGAALLVAGSAFHSVRGKTSALWDGLELTLAEAWVAGARSVPLVCQGGGYRHRTDLEGASVIRAYQRGDDPACVVKIRP